MPSIKKIIGLVLLLGCSTAFAEEFVIQKIRITGLQRINSGTALSYLPVKEGDRIDTSQTADIIKALYKTGFFTDVNLKREGNTLAINVVERAVIGAINVTGNKKITKKQMDDLLKNAGLIEGQAVDHSLLNAIEQALIQQYYNLGIYNAQVTTSITPEPRNRVTVNINIKEGPAAKIKAIKIIGNSAFSEKILLKQFTLTTPKLWSFITHSDQYSKEKLDADLEALRSYYMDRGYLHFKVVATPVAITPDKKHIYITVQIEEGPVYHFSGFSLDGNLIGKRAEMLRLIDIKSREIFSRRQVIDVQSSINEFLGDFGYGMPEIKTIPEVDESAKTVFIKFTIEPGRRVYVRQINFIGNNKTHDEVLRREMRLQEGALFSLTKINESKRRLANLGYLQDVDFKVEPVAGNPDQVDLTYNFKETSAISANFQAGFSDADGFLYGISLGDQNFLGTGKTVSIGFDNSRDTHYYSLNYYDPYFTINGISLSLSGYLQTNNPANINLTSYSANTYGAQAIFGVPFSDYNRLNFGYGVEHIEITTTTNSGWQVMQFVNKYGKVFNQLKLITGWSYNSFDRAIFPTRGFAQSLNFEVGLPVGKKSVEYYKGDYNASWFYPLIKNFIFHANGEAGYGHSFGKTKTYPFFKNFFAGGIGTVRGYEAGSLGPRDQLNNPVGGNIITVASASLIVPAPMRDAIRLSLYTDVGNVYKDTFKGSQLRSSYGVQLEWRTPIAPLVFSLGKPLTKHRNDKPNAFEFSISTSI